MKRILLVTPVFRRHTLTEIMLRQRKRTFEQVRQAGAEAGCVCIGDEKNLEVADSLGFHSLESPNILGKKYNDGHQFAVKQGYDISFQTNSDQVFDPELLVKLANSPTDRIIRTEWLTFVHCMGSKSLAMRNPVWAMLAYPTAILAKVPNSRPCQEDIMSMCDTSTHDGVRAANPDIGAHTVVHGPLETIQFESGFQITPWKKNLMVAAFSGIAESPVDWTGIAELHGQDFADEMKEFYAV